MTYARITSPTLIQAVRRLLHERHAMREPIGLTKLVALCVSIFGIAVLFIEWQNLQLALTQLFPTLSDGRAVVDPAGLIGLGSMAAIVMGDLLLDKASEHWSERTHRRVDTAGLVSLGLFVVSAMVLLPASIAQANDVATANDGSNPFSLWAYLAFALMLAAWFPMSLFTNFVLFQKLKPALQRINRTWQHDRTQRATAARLDTYVHLTGALGEAQHNGQAIPDDAELVRQSAAEIAAAIGEVESELNGVILRRKAAATASPDAPLAATDSDYLNHVPIEALLTHRDYLRSFTPDAIAQLLNKKGA